MARNMHASAYAPVTMNKLGRAEDGLGIQGTTYVLKPLTEDQHEHEHEQEQARAFYSAFPPDFCDFCRASPRKKNGGFGACHERAIRRLNISLLRSKGDAAKEGLIQILAKSSIAAGRPRCISSSA